MEKKKKIGIVLCVILVPILIVNCTLIIKSYTNKDEVPNSVKYYFQNVNDDGYTQNAAISVNRMAKTGTIVSDDDLQQAVLDYYGVSENDDYGFTPLYHYPEAVAADGSTVFECYYDRNYYIDRMPGMENVAEKVFKLTTDKQSGRDDITMHYCVQTIPDDTTAEYVNYRGQPATIAKGQGNSSEYQFVIDYRQAGAYYSGITTDVDFIDLEGFKKYRLWTNGGS